MFTKVVRKIAEIAERASGHCGGGSTGHCS
jgi:hypothetical protein